MLPTVYTAVAVEPTITRAVSNHEAKLDAINALPMHDFTNWMSDMQEDAEVDLLRRRLDNLGFYESYNEFESR